jgi:hypothetical protein
MHAPSWCEELEARASVQAHQGVLAVSRGEPPKGQGDRRSHRQQAAAQVRRVEDGTPPRHRRQDVSQEEQQFARRHRRFAQPWQLQPKPEHLQPEPWRLEPRPEQLAPQLALDSAPPPPLTGRATNGFVSQLERRYRLPGAKAADPGAVP